MCLTIEEHNVWFCDGLRVAYSLFFLDAENVWGLKLGVESSMGQRGRNYFISVCNTQTACNYGLCLNLTEHSVSSDDGLRSGDLEFFSGRVSVGNLKFWGFTIEGSTSRN